MANILVIDDEGAIVRLVQKMLSGAYTLASARDGASGLAHVIAHRPDVVIVDSDLPRIDGAEVCRRVNASPETAHIAVVLMTPNYVDFFAAQPAFEPNAVLIRPFTRETLQNTVARVLTR